MLQLKQDKLRLKKLRETLQLSSLDFRYVEELVLTINTIIGRINCELTQDDNELEQLAKLDGLRD